MVLRFKLDYTCRARWPEELLRRRASKYDITDVNNSSARIDHFLDPLFSTSKSVYERDLGGHLFFRSFLTLDWDI